MTDGPSGVEYLSMHRNFVRDPPGGGFREDQHSAACFMAWCSGGSVDWGLGKTGHSARDTSTNPLDDAAGQPTQPIDPHSIAQPLLSSPANHSTPKVRGMANTATIISQCVHNRRTSR
jgi:hypothetical protein